MHYALRHGTPIHYFEWLLDHGADPLLPDKDGTVPVAEAARRGRRDVLELFENRDVTIALEGDDAFLAACARANEVEARMLAVAEPSMIEPMQIQNPGMLADFAGAGNTAAVRLMLDLGFRAGIGRIKLNWVASKTALHVVAAHGGLPVAQLLIERGAPLDAKRHNGRTPLGVAFLAWSSNRNGRRTSSRYPWFCRFRRVLHVVESSCSGLWYFSRFLMVFGGSWTEVDN
jgi:ankyrin repeat protein